VVLASLATQGSDGKSPTTVLEMATRGILRVIVMEAVIVEEEIVIVLAGIEMIETVKETENPTVETLLENVKIPEGRISLDSQKKRQRKPKNRRKLHHLPRLPLSSSSP